MTAKREAKQSSKKRQSDDTEPRRPKTNATDGESSPNYLAFVDAAAREQRVWGLFRDGWALTTDASGAHLFPLWPSKEHAQRCAKGSWEGFEPEAIPLDDLVDQLLPQLAQDKVGAGIAPEPGRPALTPPMAQLIRDLESRREPDAEGEAE